MFGNTNTPGSRAKRLAVGTIALGAATLGYAAGIERRRWTLRTAELPVLAPGSQPIKVLHVSDLHMLPGHRSKQRWVAALDALEPDLVVNTGDNLSHPQAVPAVLRALGPLLEAGGIPVVTGYIAATAKGIPTTLGRGGSDFSATILGAALDAQEIIIWTDVNGVLTADPRIVPDAVTLEEVSYSEAGELAFFGAKVLHPMTLRPVIESGIPVWIRNSFEPHKAGTKITQTARPSAQCVKAVTATRDVALITVAGPGIIGVPDIAARIFVATASVRANIVMISQSSSQDSICFVVQAADAVRTEKALRDALYEDVHHHELEHVTVNRNVAVVAAVGENMAGTPGIAGRVFSTLGDEGINMIAIAQGSSEYNISFLVEASGMEKAVKALHRTFGLGQAESREEVSTGAKITTKND